MEWTRLGLVFLDIVLPLLTGYLLKTHNIISRQTCGRLIQFNVVVFCTFINFISFWGLKLSASLLLLPLASILLTVVPGLIGYLFLPTRSGTNWTAGPTSFPLCCRTSAP